MAKNERLAEEVSSSSRGCVTVLALASPLGYTSGLAAHISHRCSIIASLYS